MHLISVAAANADENSPFDPQPVVKSQTVYAEKICSLSILVFFLNLNEKIFDLWENNVLYSIFV